MSNPETNQGQSPNSDGGNSQITDPPPNKLFVGGLSWQTTTDKLRDYFSAFGTVTDVLIMKDPVTLVSHTLEIYSGKK
jgi:RNA-binding protein Musashi